MVYFIRQEDTIVVKIGWSTSPLERVAQLQTGNAAALYLFGVIMTKDKELEPRLHELFGASSIRGEWFAFHEPQWDEVMASPAFRLYAHGRYWEQPCQDG
ncbi:MAG: GIY-YIG nuclease family protein [bacterium]|nr:GIY-YIG nuclease family protein [bacterium]